MLWKQPLLDQFAEHARFVVRLCLIGDALLLAGFSLWLVWHLVRHLGGLLSRTVFSEPW